MIQKKITKGCYIRFIDENGKTIYGSVLSVIKDVYKIEHHNQKGESIVTPKKLSDLTLIGNYN